MKIYVKCVVFAVLVTALEASSQAGNFGISGRARVRQNDLTTPPGFNRVDYVMHANPRDWHGAAQTCHEALSDLLCFGSRAEIVSIIKNSLETWGGIEMWIGKKDCTKFAATRCASLAIKDFGKYNETWLFSFNCSKSLPYICKITREETTTVGLTTTQDPSSSYVTCPAVLSRDIMWPESIGGTKVRMQCPPGQKGFAFWTCSAKARNWYPDNPNLSDCKTVHLNQVLRKMPVIDIHKTTNELWDTIQSLKYGGDLATAVEILDKVDDVYRSQAPTMTAAQRREVVQMSSEDIIKTCDKLIDTQEAWKDIPQERRLETATKFLSAVDETGSLLISNVDEQNTLIATMNVVLKVVKPQQNSYETVIHFPMDRTLQNKLALISIPTPNQIPIDNESGIIFAWYSDLSSVLPADQNDPLNDQNPSQKRMLNSAVVSANLTGKLSNTELNGEVEIVLEHFNSDASNPQCVYWDTKALKWNNRGCRLKQTNATHTTCACNHLTNFAILMDIHCSTCELSQLAKFSLSVVTMTGCLVSIFCLSLCIVIFTWFRSLWGIQTTIHRNLCVTLWWGEMLLLIGLDRTENKMACSIVAGFLHYFFLSAFFWMFLEAFHILLLVIHVFTPHRLRVTQYYVVGYGAPALIVGITAAMRHQDYGTPHSCWLSTENGTIWSFVGPVMGILLFNTVALIKAIWITLRITKSKEKTNVEGLRMWIRGAAVLLPLLGVTWSIGFLYLFTSSIYLSYAFAVLNSLQGFAIFVFHVLLNKKVKGVVAKSIERSSMSRSGTYRTTKSSSVKSWKRWLSKRDKSETSDTPGSPETTLTGPNPPLTNDVIPPNGDELKEEDFHERLPLNPRIVFTDPVIPTGAGDDVPDVNGDIQYGSQPDVVETAPVRIKLETEIT